MKLTTGILAAAIMTGGAWAQNPNIVNNVQNKMTAVDQQKAADSDAALGLQEAPASAQASKPSAGAPTPAGKPVAVTAKKPSGANDGAAEKKPIATAPSKPAAVAASTSTPENKLERVEVVRHANEIQIEIGTRETVKPTVDKLTKPDRLVIQIPATAMATAKSKIPVGAGGVKGVRIGMNSKTPPTTSVVIDLEHAVSYELSSGPANKFTLTLHAQAGEQVAAQAPAKVPAKVAAAQAPAKTPQTQAVAKPVSVTPTPAPKVAIVAPAQKPVNTAKILAPVAAPKAAATARVATVKVEAPKTAPTSNSKTIAAAASSKPAKIGAAEPVKAATVAAPKTETADDKVAPIANTADAAKAPKPDDKKWAMSGKRDPFFSPVVQQATGSGCTTGKKCLEIGQINVRGIVKSQDGFIAVVTNSLNKAYFLHENDPVFNGYVMRITGDTVVFQETYEDKLGKPVTREVTKRVSAPAV
jgi:hypothetical protein